MELIEMELSDVGRRSRSVELAHGDSGLDRGLRPDEVVVLRHADGTAYLALVRDVSRDADELRYRLELGEKIRIPDQVVDEASRRLADIDGTRVPRPPRGGAAAR